MLRNCEELKKIWNIKYLKWLHFLLDTLCKIKPIELMYKVADPRMS